MPEVVTCKTCNKKFPLTKDYFYRHSQNVSGFLGSCKTCVIGKVKGYRKDNAKVLEYDRRRSQQQRDRY